MHFLAKSASSLKINEVGRDEMSEALRRDDVSKK